MNRCSTPCNHWFIQCWRPSRPDLTLSWCTAIGWTDACPSVHLMLLRTPLVLFCLVQTDHWINRQSNQPDCRFIWCYWFLRADRCLFSWVHPTQLEIGPSVHPTMTFCCFLCVFNLSLLELNMPSLNMPSLNRPSLIASKYILTLDF
jgi:hypothetical protein